MKIGDRIKAARLMKGLTRQDVADRLGVNVRTVGNWEDGATTPSALTFIAYAEIIGIDTDLLMGARND